jgi:hypothetical protein
MMATVTQTGPRLGQMRFKGNKNAEELWPARCSRFHPDVRRQ